MERITTNTTRITSIDFLRAFALFGIILVHFRNGFGHNFSPILHNSIDWQCHLVIGKLLVNRCATIFNILFGVSFYLILKKPEYPAKKFLFRCFLLLLIGLINKFIYTFDVLMWYGICGMILVAFRGISKQRLPIIILILFLLKFICEYIFNEYVDFPDVSCRYVNANIFGIITSWHIGVLDYFIITIKKGLFGTLAYFLIGYYLGQKGYLYKLYNIRLIHVFLTIIIYVALGIVRNLSPVLHEIYLLSGAFCYTFILMWLYYHTPLRRFFDFFCSYGKLGLTNYSTQGVIGVIAYNVFNIEILPFSIITLLAISIFIIQAIFSHYWLKVYRFGPMEWVWRCLTNKHFTSMKIKTT